MVAVHFKSIRKEILRCLDRANNKIVVAVYWFTNDQLFNKLIEKLDQKVSVELVVHNDYVNNRANGLPLKTFLECGGKLYFSKEEHPMHNKFCVIDDIVLINGSYNWTYYAEDKNKENILVIEEESDLAAQFLREFENLKSSSIPVTEITPLTKYELDEQNSLQVNSYLANDLLSKALIDQKPGMVAEAVELAPHNIAFQKRVSESDLQRKLKTKTSLGVSIIDDGFLELVPKNQVLPYERFEFVYTATDNQTASKSNLMFGDSTSASKNTLLCEMRLDGLPPKKAGEAKMKYHVTVNINGFLKVKKVSLDNGKDIEVGFFIKHLLEDV